MPLSYTIDYLLLKDKQYEESDTKRTDRTPDSSFSDAKKQSDDEKCTSSANNLKQGRRYKSNIPEDMRLKLSHRERQRMHDLNSALNSLRQTLPYSHEPSVKRISKISTLILARNYILTLINSLEEMRKLVGEMTKRQTTNPHTQSSVAISPELIHSMCTLNPNSSSRKNPSTLFTSGIQRFSSGASVQSVLLPCTIASSARHITSHGPVLPFCPCTYCQVSLVSLPRHDRKQTCS